MNSIDQPISLDSLVTIDVQKLTGVLEFLLSRLKFHDGLIRDNAKMTESLGVDVIRTNDRLRNLEETCVSFVRGVDDVNKMKDKLAAWSERFKELEQMQFQIRKEVKSAADELTTKLEDLDEIRRKDEMTSLQELKTRHENDDSRVSSKMIDLQTALEDLQLDMRLGFERAERTSNARFGEMFGVIEASTPVANESSQIVQVPQAPLGNNPIRSLFVRIKSLETKLSDLLHPSPQDANVIFENYGLDLDIIHTEIGKDQLIQELQNKLYVIATVRDRQQANQFALQLEEARSELEPRSPFLATEKPKVLKFASIHQRLEELELQLQTHSLKFVSLTEKLDQTCDHLDSLQTRLHKEESVKSRARTLSKQNTVEIQEQEPVVRRPSNATPVLQPTPIINVEHIKAEVRDEMDTFRDTVDHLEDAIEKMKKLIKDKVSHNEAEEIATSIVKRANKNTPQKQGTASDVEGKVMEIETRLNNYWRNFQEVQTHIHNLKQTTNDLDTKFKLLLEEKSSEAHEFASSGLSQANKKIEEMKPVLDKLAEDKSTGELLENEQYLRSMVLKLKTDVQKLQIEFESQQNKGPDTSPLISDIHLDALPEEIETRKLHGILQQHDQAIRYLASKLTGTPMSGEDGGKQLDSATTLLHLEQLRAEMKEILSKHDASRSLSAKEIDLLNEITAALDTKIGKEELTLKVDRAELVKIYRQLKRKTDQLSDAVKRAETTAFGAGREDVFFSKKRLDAECASCGQLLPENVDLQAQAYQPWGRFPSRSNVVGPGFSRILSSIVSSPTGSISIQRRLEGSEDPSPLQSPNISIPNTRARRRNPVKLPSVK